jgi:putative flippase GtrA
MNFLFKNKKQFFVFVAGGGMGALINLAVTSFFTEIMGLSYLISYSVGISANIIFNFFYHRSITFKTKNKFKTRFFKSVFVSMAVGAAVMTLVYIFTEIFGFWYIFSGIIAISVMTLINYIVNNLWVFQSYES